MRTTETSRDSNPDAITGAPGSHPVGAGVGAAAGGLAAGAALGAVAGPIGAVVGAVAGGIAGGYGGKAVGESIDPTVEDAYWRQNHTSRPYFQAGTSYDEYGPAYRYGWENRGRYAEESFESVEPDLERDWQTSRGNSSLTWDRAKLAVRDAWDRTGNAVSGGSKKPR